MSSAKSILASMLPTLIGLAVGVMCASLIDCHRRGSATEQTADTVRVTVTDTVRVVQPIARDSVVVRYKTAWLPIRPHNTQSVDISAATCPQNGAIVNASDSAEVVIPITQKVYSDSTYTAWVSGWEPTLDSIEVYQRTEFVTVKPKPKPWSIGVSAGYGLTPKGLQPYIGVGVTYNIRH